MCRIKYNLDQVCCVNDDDFRGIKIDGWCFSEDGSELTVEIKGCNNFLLYRTERDDVSKAYKEFTVSKQAGFHVEISYSNAKEELFLIMKNVKTQEEVKIDIVSLIPQKTKFKACSSVKMKDVINFLRMRITDDICYRIENFWLDSVSNVILLSGWAFDQYSSNIVRILEPDGKLIRVSRQDVKDYYEKRNLDATCGFEIQIPLNESTNCIEVEIGSGKDKIILSFDYKQLCKELDKKEYNRTESKGEWTKKIEKAKNIWKYGEAGADLKEKEYQIFLEESNLNRAHYSYEHVDVPEEWIKLQKRKPVISIIIPIKNVNKIIDLVIKALDAINDQSYIEYKVIFCGTDEDQKKLPSQLNVASFKVKCDETETKLSCIWKAINQCETEYFTIVEQEDIVEKHYLFSLVEAANLHPQKFVYYSDYDVYYAQEPLFPVKRDLNFKTENDFKILNAVLINTRFAQNYSSLEKFINAIRNLDEEKLFHITRITYHSNAVLDQWKNKDSSKIIAFYLPQFHENPENNKWWGEGFTEWVNVRRAYPMFVGHNQPRIPGDLGYYDLVEDKSIQHKQVEIAQKYDIAGFCFYYYWFAKKRLLEKPLNQYIEDHSLNLPFCICWANETWSRRWDGAEKEVLMQQIHNEKTDKEFIYDVMPMFKDERYIKIDGKPLLLIYRIELFPRPYKTIKRWKEICKKEGIGDIHVALVQSFGMVDHRIYGADSSVEFPPHKIVGGTINERVLSEEMKKEYTGNIYSYEEIVQNQMIVKKREYQLWPGAMLGWDNTARRLKAANVFHEFTPDLYKKWLIKNHTYTQLYNNEPYMFVNAWNEWAEGTYLEPDQKYGYTMLEISKEVSHYK